jgi:hypothetical protein
MATQATDARDRRKNAAGHYRGVAWQDCNDLSTEMDFFDIGKYIHLLFGIALR